MFIWREPSISFNNLPDIRRFLKLEDTRGVNTYLKEIVNSDYRVFNNYSYSI